MATVVSVYCRRGVSSSNSSTTSSSNSNTSNSNSNSSSHSDSNDLNNNSTSVTDDWQANFDPYAFLYQKKKQYNRSVKN